MLKRVFILLIFASVSLGGHILQLQQDLDKLFQSNSGFRLEEMLKGEPAVWDAATVQGLLSKAPPPLRKILTKALFDVGFDAAKLPPALADMIIVHIFIGWIGGQPDPAPLLGPPATLPDRLDKLQIVHMLLQSLNPAAAITKLDAYSMLLAAILPDGVNVGSVPVPFDDATSKTLAELARLVNDNKRILNGAPDPAPTTSQLVMQLASERAFLRKTSTSKTPIIVELRNKMLDLQTEGPSDPVWIQYSK
jgi:hypothetical protein